MATNYPDSEFEVVVYAGAYPNGASGALHCIHRGKSYNWKATRRVSFVVCLKPRLKRQSNSSLLNCLAGVKTVPDGIPGKSSPNRIGEGWGYIKESAY